MLQNKCLQLIAGAYKATNIKVLEAEAEAGVIPLDIYFDQAVLRSRDAPKCQEVVTVAKKKIRLKLRNKRGRRSSLETLRSRSKTHGPKML